MWVKVDVKTCSWCATILPSKSSFQDLMKILRRLSIYIWVLLKSLPQISVGRLLMPAIFIFSWTVFRTAGAADTVSFVWAIVLAQAAQVWFALPMTALRQRQTYGNNGRSLNWVLATVVVLMFLQIWWSEPWFSQRLASISCALFAFVMLLGVWGDRDVIDQFAPVSTNSNISRAFRIHLLKLYVLVPILFIATNETLVAIDATLSARVAVLSLLPIALHYFFEIAIRLICPSFEDSENQR